MKKILFAMLATVAAISASAAGVELLKNGAGTTLDGWSNENSGNGYTFEIDTAYDVSWFASSYNGCKLSQTVTLLDCGLTESEIQANPTVTASGIVLAPNQKDNSNSGSRICTVKVYELGESGNQIQEHVIMDRSGELITTPASFSGTFSLNSSTRKLRYELNGQDSVNWSGLYGPKFRNCSLAIEMQKVIGDKQVMTIGTDVTWRGSSSQSPIDAGGDIPGWRISYRRTLQWPQMDLPIMQQAEKLAERLGVAPAELIKETLRTPADLKKTVPAETLREVCEEKTSAALIARG